MGCALVNRPARKGATCLPLHEIDGALRTGFLGRHELADIDHHMWDWAAFGWRLVGTSTVTNTAPGAQEVVHYFYWEHPGVPGLGPSDYPPFPQAA